MLAIGGLIGATSSPAFSQTSADDTLSRALIPAGAETRSQTVDYSDLNLDTARGASALVSRINGAAENVCSPAPVRASNLQESSDYAQCMRQATGHAVNGIDNRAVTYEYKRRTSRW
jgi:UrcA family protein